MKNLIFLNCLLINLFLPAYACDQKSEDYQPALETGKLSDGILLTKLFIPKYVGEDELVAVIFHIDDNSLSLPVSFYSDGEIELLHKEGFATIAYTATLEKLKEITVEARYKYPTGLNGKIGLCIHSETFKLSGFL